MQSQTEQERFPTHQPVGAAWVLTEARRTPDTQAELGLKALRLIMVCTCWLHPLTQVFSSSAVSGGEASTRASLRGQDHL